MEETVSSVHLVGSIPQPSVRSVFKLASGKLSSRLKRIPDGEVGERGSFTRWQLNLFQSVPELLSYGPTGPIEAGDRLLEAEAKRLVARVPHPIETGYDTHAIESYKIFAKMQDAGDIAPSQRFQVGIPTPMNIMQFFKPQFQPMIEPIYEEAILNVIKNIQATIPAKDLAIQIDMAIDIAVIEGITAPYGMVIKPWFNPPLEGVVERVLRLVKNVGNDVELGFHMCYGDAGHAHYAQPKDLQTLVKVSNHLIQSAKRPVNWIHMPVPRSRDDTSYFAPLAELNHGQTELYLGLVHAQDEEGTRRRIAAGQKFVHSFGISTECGMGRTSVEDMVSILEIMQRVVKEQE